MKVAFCLFGLSGDNNYKSIESEKMNGNSIDIMIHSYNSYKRYIFDYNKDVDFDIYFHTRSHENINKIVEMYNPKKYIVDDKIISITKNVSPSRDHIPFLSRHDSVNKVLSLVKEEYDYIFLCRFDLNFLKPLDFSNINLKLNQYMFAENSLKYINNEVFNLTDNKHINTDDNLIEWRKLDKDDHVVDHWMIFKPENKVSIVKMGLAHSKALLGNNFLNLSVEKFNIHHFIPYYLRNHCNGDIVHSLLNHYDTCFTRYFIIGGYNLID
jgi:hypothetical protein